MLVHLYVHFKHYSFTVLVYTVILKECYLFLSLLFFPYHKLFMKLKYVSLETQHIPAVGTWSFDPDHNPSSLYWEPDDSCLWFKHV